MINLRTSDTAAAAVILHLLLNGVVQSFSNSVLRSIGALSKGSGTPRLN